MVRRASRDVQDLLDQIIRDNWTLNHCEDLCPDRDFYAARIASYYDTIRQLQEENVPCPVSKT